MKEYIEMKTGQALDIVNLMDETVNFYLSKHEHASKKFKKTQRISNALLRVKQSIETLKEELQNP